MKRQRGVHTGSSFLCDHISDHDLGWHLGLLHLDRVTVLHILYQTMMAETDQLSALVHGLAITAKADIPDQTNGTALNGSESL